MLRTATPLLCALSLGASLAASPAMAQRGLSARAWQNDLRIVQDQVMQTLREDYQDYQFPPSWRLYRNDFLERIRSERRLLDQSSYQIVRDIMLMMSEDFETLLTEGSWDQAEQYLHTKLDLTTNILALIGDSRF